MYYDALIAALDGRLTDIRNLAQGIRDHGQGTDIAVQANAIASIVSLRVRIHLGTAEGFLNVMLNEDQNRASRPFYLAFLGRREEAGEALEQFIPDLASIGAASQVMLLEAALLVRHEGAVRELLQLLSNEGLHTTGHNYTTCVARHLGAAAAFLGRPEDARSHYQNAIRVTTSMRFRPELALTRLQMAELLLEHYPDERDEALEHLDSALEEFKEMKMAPYIEKTQALKESLYGTRNVIP